MTWKSTAVASGVTVVGMWVASYAPVPGPAGTPGAPTGAGTEAASMDIQREARRLHDRLQRAGAYREPSRNPFSFAAARRAASRPVERPPAIDEPTAAVEPVPPPFRISLAGIAEDTVEGAPVRTAVISTPDGVLLVARDAHEWPEFRARAMIDWWGPVFTETYASSETGHITFIDSREWLAKPGSVGRSSAISGGS